MSNKRRPLIMFIAVLAIFLIPLIVLIISLSVLANQQGTTLGIDTSSKSSPTLFFYGGIALFAIAIYLLNRSGARRRQRTQQYSQSASVQNHTAQKHDPFAVYMGLRDQALKGFERPKTDSDQIWGALIEFGRGSANVTITSFDSGDASMYTSTGGGWLGGGQIENVRKAARNFVVVAEQFKHKMQPVTSYPLPGAGKVRFYAMSSKTIYSTEVDQKLVGSGQSDLLPLYAAGQDVITQLRLVSEAPTQ